MNRKKGGTIIHFYLYRTHKLSDEEEDGGDGRVRANNRGINDVVAKVNATSEDIQMEIDEVRGCANEHSLA